MTIRPISADDVDFALALTNVEGWAYSRPEFERILRLPHEGSLVWIDGPPAGFVTSVQFGGTAVIGHLVVSSEFRGKKVGRSLLEECLGCLDSMGIRSVLVFSTAQGRSLYESCGFRPTRRVVSYGISDAPHGRRHVPVCPNLLPEDLDEVCAVDEEVFGDDRTIVLEDLYNGHPGFCFKTEEAGRISGYVFVRSTPIGLDIGPWVSLTGSPEDAERLIAAALSVQPGGRFDMGFFGDCPLAMGALGGYPCVKRFDVQLMVRGEDRYPSSAKGALGIAAFELG